MEDMLKRDICDRLYSQAYKRYRKGYPDREFSERFLDRLWFSIYGILNHQGEDAAKEYVESAKLLADEGM